MTVKYLVFADCNIISKLALIFILYYLINVKRRDSLSSSPSDGSSTNNSKQPDFSSGKPHPFFHD